MFVKFLIHITLLEILGKLVVDMCFCLQTCISAVVMGVVIYAKFDCSSLYNVLRFVVPHARNNFTRALNYAHLTGIRAQFHFTLRKGALWRQWLSHGEL